VVQGGGWTDYEIFVPIDEHHHRAVFLTTRWTTGLGSWKWRLRYWSYIRPIYYGLLNRAQDQWMIAQMNIPPERLYRPDISVTAWRRWCDEHARRRGGAAPRRQADLEAEDDGVLAAADAPTDPGSTDSTRLTASASPEL
jgi:hypothetical protein